MNANGNVGNGYHCSDTQILISKPRIICAEKLIQVGKSLLVGVERRN